VGEGAGRGRVVHGHVDRREAEVAEDETHEHLGGGRRIDLAQLATCHPVADEVHEQLEATTDDGARRGGDAWQEDAGLLVAALGHHRVVDEEAHPDHERRLDAFGGALLLLGRGAQEALEAGRLALEERVDHRILVREVPVEGGLARTRLAGDVLHRGLADADGHEAARSCCEQVLAAVAAAVVGRSSVVTGSSSRRSGRNASTRTVPHRGGRGRYPPVRTAGVGGVVGPRPCATDAERRPRDERAYLHRPPRALALPTRRTAPPRAPPTLSNASGAPPPWRSPCPLPLPPRCPSSLDAPADWRADAACREVDVEAFFAVDEASQQEALAICETCPVRVECLEHAIAAREQYGVWGGCASRTASVSCARADATPPDRRTPRTLTGGALRPVSPAPARTPVRQNTRSAGSPTVTTRPPPRPPPPSPDPASAHQPSFDQLGTALIDVTFVVLDLETTGLTPGRDRITEVGAVKVRGGEVLGELQTLVHPVGPSHRPSARSPASPTRWSPTRPDRRGPADRPALPRGRGPRRAQRAVRPLVPAGGVRAAPPRRFEPVVVDTARLARRLLADEVRDRRLGTLARHLGSRVAARPPRADRRPGDRGRAARADRASRRVRRHHPRGPA
jgi:hypothetical protein